jgi:hypothetical protein
MIEDHREHRSVWDLAGANGKWMRLRRRVGEVAEKVAEWAQSPSQPTTATKLRPLTARYRADQHRTYVELLGTAMDDPSVRNVALTGRYGAGKSSVLEKFAATHKKRVLFLSLSTLGPEKVGEAETGSPAAPSRPSTNQIQKELVKQLLHRERPSRLPQSRYQRIDRLTLSRSALESAACLAVLGVAMWLFGAFPDIQELDGNHSPWLRFPAAALSAAALVLLVAWIRLAVHNRLEISQVSAAGASLTLAKKADSYFDQYLDEIVYFFEARQRIDVVVFEDLDRFNEAGIFEALRELNTLLNNSRQITGRPFWRGGRRTIRFVYALRDSIFEQLGRDTKELANDAAQAEAVRANRTKFFDLVVPIVPFITHRTARELLSRVLVDDELTPVPAVSDDLIDLAARHLPDMRLLTNIRNEYATFAGRLLDADGGIETLTPNKLFAMVVYKNLHLEDFELMQLGRSSLDAIYGLSRDLVTSQLASKRGELKRFADGTRMREAADQQAAQWGEQLEWFFAKSAEGTAEGRVLTYHVGDSSFDDAEIRTPDFWKELLDSQNGVDAVVFSRPYGQRNRVRLSMDELGEVLGAGFVADAWPRVPKSKVDEEQARTTADLETLRTADFKQLAARPDFLLDHSGQEMTFRSVVAKYIPSVLGRSLVTDGHIDRYYNLYMAQFYGERVPANAMSFIVQNIDQNRADASYRLATEEVSSLLKETRRSFLNDVSAYNVDILDHLLATNDDGYKLVLDNIRRHIGKDEREFLGAYLADGANAEMAVSYLASEWTQVFAEVVSSGELQIDRRIRLVDGALGSAEATVEYNLTNDVRAFLQDNHLSFLSVVLPDDEEGDSEEPGEEPADARTVNAATLLTSGGVRVRKLSTLRELASKQFVDAGAFEISVANLRAATGIEEGPLSLDALRDHPPALRAVLERPEEYLALLDEDDFSGTGETNLSVVDPSLLAEVVNDIAHLSSARIEAIVERAHENAAIVNLSAVPSRAWEALAAARRFPPTLANVDAYTEYLGEVDEALAVILQAEGAVLIPDSPDQAVEAESGSEDDRPEGSSPMRVAAYILNAATRIPDPEVRARLAASLDLQGQLSVLEVPAERGGLLASLLKHRVCPDAIETFEHFRVDDWPTLIGGINMSKNFASFISPAIVPPAMVRKLLVSPEIDASLKTTVLDRLDEFVPADDAASLTAAAKAFLALEYFPGTPRIGQIAAVTGDGDLAMQLADGFKNEMSTDEVISAIVAVGGTKYGQLATPGAKLTFPRDDHHEAVLHRLRSDDRISARSHASSMFKEARVEVEVP